MSKEPNGTLVMTTCKCRENTKNLVMTRTWFEEQLANKIAQGAALEQERIIKLLINEAIELRSMNQHIHAENYDDAIVLIKGEVDA